MPGDETKSPLDLIRQKERELAQRLREAGEKAEQELARARQQAAEIRKRAESGGLREAEQVFQQELKQVVAQAAKIEAAGNEKAERVRQLGCKLRERAARIILERVIPD